MIAGIKSSARQIRDAEKMDHSRQEIGALKKKADDLKNELQGLVYQSQEVTQELNDMRVMYFQEKLKVAERDLSIEKLKKTLFQ